MNTLKYLPHLFTSPNSSGTNNEAQKFLSRGASVIVRMRGLPYDCSAQQVVSTPSTSVSIFLLLRLSPSQSAHYLVLPQILSNQDEMNCRIPLNSSSNFLPLVWTDWIFFVGKRIVMWCHARWRRNLVCAETRWKINRRCLCPVWDGRRGSKGPSKT